MIKVENEDGKEIEAYTAEEVEAAKEAAKKEVADVNLKAIADKDIEIARLNKISAEKTENFKKYNQMTDDEKKAYDANTTELLKRNDLTQAELEEVKTKLAEKETKEKEYTKNSILKGLHNNDEKTKKTIEDNYSYLAGMPESTPEEIAARAGAAARLAGIQVDPRNPLYSAFSGEAPKPKEEGKEFSDTDKGKEAVELARSALNIKVEDKK